MQIARASPAGLPCNRSPWRVQLAAALAVLLCTCAGTARAATDCSITAVSVNFGAYDPVATAPDDSVGTLSITCRYLSGNAERVNFTVMLSNGMDGTNATTRRMAAGTARLGYNVFTDPARTQVWGNGTGGTVIASGSMTIGPGVGNGTQTVTLPVYGRIPQLQDAVPGTYNDTLVLTLTF